MAIFNSYFDITRGYHHDYHLLPVVAFASSLWIAAMTSCGWRLGMAKVRKSQLRDWWPENVSNIIKYPLVNKHRP